MGGRRPRLGSWVKPLVVVAGLGALVVGVLAVFTADQAGGTAAAALVVTGAVLLALGALGRLPESVEFGSFKATLTPERLEDLALQADRRGLDDVARRLRGVSAELGAKVDPLLQIYRSLRPRGSGPALRQR